jgi:hypothetical protein
MNLGAIKRRPLVPAKAGIQWCKTQFRARHWIPACAGISGGWTGVLAQQALR